MKSFLFVMYLCVFYFSGQDKNWKHYSIESDSLGTVNFHVDNFEIDKKKPILLFLQGSGNLPLFYQRTDGSKRTSTTINIRKYAKEFHIVFISKPGIPFFDKLQTSENGRHFYPNNKTYDRYYSFDWRADSASEVIDFLLKKLKVDEKQIIVMGHSEGSQIAPAVAIKNPKVTHVVAMMGNSLPHFYDFILNERLKAEKGEISRAEAQKRIDFLYQQFEKIEADPQSTTKRWFGATYKKWSSFNKKSPLDYMLELKIPILYIAGGNDRNQTILGMDYAKLEFIRRKKKNLTYKVFLNCDHFFQDSGDSTGNKKVTDRIDEIHDFAISWVKEKSK